MVEKLLQRDFGLHYGRTVRIHAAVGYATVPILD